MCEIQLTTPFFVDTVELLVQHPNFERKHLEILGDDEKTALEIAIENGFVEGAAKLAGIMLGQCADNADKRRDILASMNEEMISKLNLCIDVYSGARNADAATQVLQTGHVYKLLLSQVTSQL